MGLFDRLFGSRSSSVKVSGASADAKPARKEETFFLDPDAATSLGDVNFMRRSNTIRHTFPGNADSPGGKEMVQEVASMEARLEKMSPGLAGTSAAPEQAEVDLTGGVPNKPKKTFAQQISAAELEQRLKGAAVKGVNDPAARPGAERKAGSGGDQPATGGQGVKPGATEAFRDWARDLNA
ncbi:MAG: hypothetical protein VKI81_09610 [Synechococcaceae cyanobacterium]|nr:hypothetical protein [Synechococcaceae cyanobacterium]